MEDSRQSHMEHTNLQYLRIRRLKQERLTTLGRDTTTFGFVSALTQPDLAFCIPESYPMAA